MDGFHQESKRSRYRIIERRREEELTAWEIKRGPIPPKVLFVVLVALRCDHSLTPSSRCRTASEIPATPPREEMKIYDAVEESDSRANMSVSQLSSFVWILRVHRLPSNDGTTDDATNQFVSMLEEYLTCRSLHFIDSTEIAHSFPAMKCKTDQRFPVSRHHQVLRPRRTSPHSRRTMKISSMTSTIATRQQYYQDLPWTVTMSVARSDCSESVNCKRSLSSPVFRGIDVFRQCRAGLEEGENILSVELDSEEEDEADQDSNGEFDFKFKLRHRSCAPTFRFRNRANEEYAANLPASL